MHPLFDNGEHLLPMKILIVEDAAVVRAVLRMTLPPDFSVIEASNAAEGAEQHAKEKPDLIITDLSMPGVSGLDLIKQIRMSDPVVPIIAISGVKSLLRIADLAGADATISKPVSPSHLLAIVNQLLPPPH